MIFFNLGGIRLNLLKLEYFVAVAKYKSFTKAAQKFHVAQPAISHQIKSLEQEIGFQLIDRTTKGFTLTEAGHSLLQDSNKLLNEFSLAIEKCQSIARNYHGYLTIGIIGWNENVYLRKLLGVFKQHYPNINVQLKRVFLKTIEEDIKNREYDCTLTMPYDLTDKKGIGTVNIVRCPAYALVSKLNALSMKSSISRKELASENCIIFESFGMEKSKEHLLSFFKSEGLTPNEIRSVSDRQIMDILLSMNEGIAIAPEMCEGVPELDIIKLPIEGAPHLIDLSLIYNKDIENQALQYFLEISRREASKINIEL